MRPFQALAGWTLLALCAGAGPAAADPCDAVPDKGPLPAYLAAGRSFAGPVVYVGDGDSLCVAVSPGRAGWVEVRLADFFAPELREPGGAEAKARLERLVMGRRLDCLAGHRSYDRIVASCRLEARPLGDLLRARGAPEGGRGR